MGLVEITVSGGDKSIEKVKGTSAKHILKLSMLKNIFTVTAPVRVNQEDKDYIRHYAIQYLKNRKAVEAENFTNTYSYYLDGVLPNEKIYKYLTKEGTQSYILDGA